MEKICSLGEYQRVSEISHFDYNKYDSCLLQTVFTGLDHHQTEAVFATCGQQVDIWDEQRSSPIRSFTWGVDSFSAVRFNPVEVRHHVSTTLRLVSHSEEHLSMFKLISKWSDFSKCATLLISLMVCLSTD